MKDLIILSGLPGSGKSSWALEHKKGYKIINGHEIKIFFNKYTSEIIPFNIFILEIYTVNLLLYEGYSVIIDDINLEPYVLQEWIKLAHEHDIDYEILFFDTPLDECIEHDSKHEKSIGKDVILEMHKKYFVAEYPFFHPNTVIMGK